MNKTIKDLLAVELPKNMTFFNVFLYLVLLLFSLSLFFSSSFTVSISSPQRAGRYIRDANQRYKQDRFMDIVG